MYHCAQNSSRQHKPKKATQDSVKTRDKEQMDTFKCHGWLSIKITDGGEDAFVKFQHEDDHVPYWNIDVPLEVQDYVRKNFDLGPTKVCFIILSVFRILFYKNKLSYGIIS
jgi:hypothetical protein